MKHFPDDLHIRLLAGDVVLLPTDTVYGLAASPINTDATSRIYKLKQRSKDLNLSIMVPSINELKNLGVDLNKYVQRLLESPYIPGAITIVVGFVTVPSTAWLSGRDEVAIRIPNDANLLSLLTKTGPLLVTSANKHGKPVPNNIPEILEQLKGKPDMIIDGGLLETIASTIINCRLDPPVIEREGRIPKNELLKWIH